MGEKRVDKKKEKKIKVKRVIVCALIRKKS